MNLATLDPAIHSLIVAEEKRQREKIRLIASENYVSQAVMEATGSVFTNKYSEGYPGKRFYEGQQCVDPLESLAIERALGLFGAEHANVQPYSGSPANLAVYAALLQPGDAVLGMELPHGGHLTHGSKASVTGKWFQCASYGLDPVTGRIDMEAVRALALAHKPKLLIAGHSAYPRIPDFAAFRAIADEVGAVLMIDMAHFAGLVAAGVHPNPVPFADIVTTTTHKSLRGPRGAMILCRKEFAAKIDRAVFPGLQGGPHNHTTAAIAVALLEASQDSFKDYGRQILSNAAALAQGLLDAGIPLVTGGTENHLILADLRPLGIGGKPAAELLDQAGLVCNANTVPFDTAKAATPSGIRLGTPAVTTRGMKEPEMARIAVWIALVLKNPTDNALIERIAQETRAFALGFPVP
jgi:glycine hydroxymethyltransferase